MTGWLTDRQTGAWGVGLPEVGSKAKPRPDVLALSSK